MKSSCKSRCYALLAGAAVGALCLGVSAPSSAQQASGEPQLVAAASQQQRHGGHRGDRAGSSSRRDHNWDRRHSGLRDDWRRPDWRYSHRYRYRHFDHDYWRRGHWYHGYRGGQFAWWWGLGNDWYAYDIPVYPYPDPATAPPPVYYDPNAVQPAPAAPPPPPVVAGNPPLVFDPYTGQYKPQGAAASYYYCYSPPGYYPDVTSCPSGWVARPG